MTVVSLVPTATSATRANLLKCFPSLVLNPRCAAVTRRDDANVMCVLARLEAGRSSLPTVLDYGNLRGVTQAALRALPRPRYRGGGRRAAKAMALLPEIAHCTCPVPGIASRN